MYETRELSIEFSWALLLSYVVKYEGMDWTHVL
jgi:hypothetical protein